MIRAGELSERVTIEEDRGASEGLQGRIPEWVVLRAVWADVQHIDATEFYGAAHAQSEATLRVTIRWPHGLELTPEHRLTWRAMPLGIVSIDNPDQRNERLVLLCKEWSG